MTCGESGDSTAVIARGSSLVWIGNTHEGDGKHGSLLRYVHTAELAYCELAIRHTAPEHCVVMSPIIITR